MFTNSILETAMSNEVSMLYSLTGQPPPIPNAPKKLEFRKLQLYKVVMGEIGLLCTYVKKV